MAMGTTAGLTVSARSALILSANRSADSADLDPMAATVWPGSCWSTPTMSLAIDPVPMMPHRTVRPASDAARREALVVAMCVVVVGR